MGPEAQAPATSAEPLQPPVGDEKSPYLTAACGGVNRQWVLGTQQVFIPRLWPLHRIQRLRVVDALLEPTVWGRGSSPHSPKGNFKSNRNQHLRGLHVLVTLLQGGKKGFRGGGRDSLKE